MDEHINESGSLFWLHVPLQTTRGAWLILPALDGRLTVLGHPARLCERPLPDFGGLKSMDPVVIGQFLLFDPISEGEARSIFRELVARMPVLSLRLGVSLRIPAGELHKSVGGFFNGPLPSLIPADVKPNPVWAEGEITCYRDGADALRQLAACPAVHDERIKAAIDLAIGSHYDFLPRSVFLSLLTIIDSLAVQKDRPDTVRQWLEVKISEARSLGDQALISGLQQLKRTSHMSAVRELVGRAARAEGEQESEIKERQTRVAQLYKLRSGLSHDGKGGLDGTKVAEAREIAKFVLEAAIEHPGILDADL
jgi:hypothetical protein